MAEYDLTHLGKITPLYNSKVPMDVHNTTDYMDESAVEDLSDNDLPDDEFQRRYNKPMPNPSTITYDMTANEAANSSSYKEQLTLRDVVEIRKTALQAALKFYEGTDTDDKTVLVMMSKFEAELIGENTPLSPAAAAYFNEVSN